MFLIQAPRILVGWPSGAIWMPSANGVSSGCRQRVSSTQFWCSAVPIGMISVFSRLNLAPEAVHQVLSRCSRVS